MPVLRPTLLLAVVAPMIVSAQAPAELDRVELAQLIFRERVVVRIPRVSPAPLPSARMAEPARPAWTEKRAPDCVEVEALTGASVNRMGEIDLIVGDPRRGAKRLRAKLDDGCPALDFYSGFYLKQNRDGKVCARRDSIRSRSGARCAITGFRTLVARK